MICRITDMPKPMGWPVFSLTTLNFNTDLPTLEPVRPCRYPYFQTRYVIEATVAIQNVAGPNGDAPVEQYWGDVVFGYLGRAVRRLCGGQEGEADADHQERRKAVDQLRRRPGAPTRVRLPAVPQVSTWPAQARVDSLGTRHTRWADSSRAAARCGAVVPSLPPS